MIYTQDRRLITILLSTAFLVLSGSSSADAATLTPPAGYSASQRIFDDQFTSMTLDSNWNGSMGDAKNLVWTDAGSLPLPYSSVGDDGAYDAEYADPYPAAYGTNTTGNHTMTGNGLQLIATPSSKFSPLYSWAAGAISSEKKFTLPATGGYVQIQAKMPDSRYGAWGGLWFLDGGAEIDLMESGYLNGGSAANANEMFAANLHSSGNNQIVINTGEDLSAAYHTYGMEYNPSKWIKFYLDGNLMGTYTQNIPTGAYELILDLNMMSSQGASWHTVSDPINHPGPFELDVSDVQIYSLSGGQTTSPTAEAFAITSPSSGTTVSGTFPVTGITGSNWLNVVGYNSSGVKVCPDTTPSSGAFTLTCNASLLSSGSNTLTIGAFSTPAGQSGYTESTLPLTVNVQSVQNLVPSVTLKTSATSVASGASATLTWSSANTTSCIGSGFSTAGATSGSVSVAPSATTNYSVSCSGAGGSATQSVSVAVNAVPVSKPVINSFSANPASITSGQSSTLSWSVTGATSLTVNGASVSGTSLSVSPNATTAYTLNATDAAGSVAQTINVMMAAATTTPPAASAFVLTSPSSDSTVSGTFSITGITGPDWLNVAGYETNGTKVCPDSTPSGGTFTLNCNSALLSNGTNTISVEAFTTPAGQSGYTENTLPLIVDVENTTSIPNPSIATLEQSLSKMIQELTSLVTQMNAAGAPVPVAVTTMLQNYEGDTSASGSVMQVMSTVSQNTRAFSTDLGLGSTGSQVRLLQQYLNTHGYPIAGSGPGSAGNETEYFGVATQIALMKLQIAAGITPANGYLGPKTRNYLALH